MNEVDIEMMLETIERLEDRRLDVVPLFYNQRKNVLEKFENLEKSMPKLSNILKQFIKTETGKTDIQVDYLKGLLKFMKAFRPFHIFSTNYDVCIERFCVTNNKSYFDGFFDGKWDPVKFANTGLNKDLVLYKLHGSVTWSRDERGRYTRNEIAIIDTGQPQINIVTGEKEVPLISYPGRKLEYFEPIFDLMVELKNRLYNPNLKYIFVVGYSFRDDHIRTLVQYASERNHDFILFLVGPSAHEIYQNNLKRYKDIDFVHSFEGDGSFTERSFNVTKASSLIGRVIRLPYKFEMIVDLLHDTYLLELRNGIEKEGIEVNKDQNEIPRWHECLEHFVACEYFDKVEDIINKNIGGWDKLMKFDYNLYKLGWKIIIKSLLNTIFLDQDRSEWSGKAKKYLVDLANGVEVAIEDSMRLMFKFKHSYERPSVYADTIYLLFKDLFEIYDNHPFFANDDAREQIAKTGLKISEIHNYFSKWRENVVHINDYIKLREDQYSDEILTIRKFAEKASTDINECISAVKKIEHKELLGLCSYGSIKQKNE